MNFLRKKNHSSNLERGIFIPYFVIQLHQRNYFIKLGNYILLYSTICLPLYLLVMLIGWHITPFFYGIKQQISLGSLLVGASWRFPSFGILLWIGFIISGSAIELFIYIAHSIDLIKYRIFGPPNKAIMAIEEDLKNDLDSLLRTSIVVISFIFTFIGEILILLQKLSMFWVICITMSGTMGGIYFIFLIKHRNLKKNSFYWLRKLVVPYLIMSSIISVITIYATYLMWYLHVRFITPITFDLHSSIAQYVPQDIIQKILEVSEPWSIQIFTIIQVFIWCFASSLIIVWILPIIVKKDFLGLFWSVLAILPPIIDQYFKIASRLLSEKLQIILSHIPLPAISFVLLLLMGMVTSKILSILGHSIKCPNCSTWLKRTHYYCNFCGEKIPESE